MTVDQQTAIFYNPVFNNLAIVVIPTKVAGEEDMWLLVAGSSMVH